MGGRTIIWSISDRTPRQVFDETISAGDTRYNFASRGVAQLVAHLLWEQEAGSSSLLSPTNSFHPIHFTQHISHGIFVPMLVMSISDISINTLSGQPTSLGGLGAKVMLVVNVASKCGLTPQYTCLEALHEKYAAQGFRVVGVPCNQFMGQEPGTADEIATFCSATYGVTFPLLEKIDVNGDNQHAIYQQLNAVADAEGVNGDIRWNFEKFLVSGSGEILGRFSPMITPEDPALVTAIESHLK